MAEQSSIYPQSPKDIPADLVSPTPKYKKHAWLAMAGLTVFMLFYIALMCGFGYMAVDVFQTMQIHKPNLPRIIVFVSATLLTVFMAKSLFVVNRAGSPGGFEVSASDEPKLFEFLHTLADEVGAPRPHRVFITPDVNAAVFYDLSLLNLFFPSKKNLLIGLGLVNVLNLGELKAVLAHEFGHFSQKSMIVGRWVYIAQQIVAHMVATRDWLDALIRFVSRVDLRIAWLGWLLGLLVWCIRSLMDTVFSWVVIAERALSREMEFNADLVAVSLTGSDALIDALHKLQTADHAWQVVFSELGRQGSDKKVIDDFFAAQSAVIEQMRKLLGDDDYGQVAEKPEHDKANHRVFEQQMALPPQMWATHPQNSDRERNAKANYVDAQIDGRSGWCIFADADELKRKVSQDFYDAAKVKDFTTADGAEAIVKRFDRRSYSPDFRGAYLNRSTMRNFDSIDNMLSQGQLAQTAEFSVAQLYPAQLSDDLQVARDLEVERQTLLSIQRGELKPSGGVIRFRDDVIGKKDIAEVLQTLDKERKAAAQKLMFHDASARRAYLQAAEKLSSDWYEYLLSLNHALHYAEHSSAKVADELALLINTWQVITADGTIGFFEKRRILKVARHFEQFMRQTSVLLQEFELPSAVSAALEISNWQEQRPVFDFPNVDSGNWHQWCPAAMEHAQYFVSVFEAIGAEVLEQLIGTEQLVMNILAGNAEVEVTPTPSRCPAQYPLLMPGDEHVLQRKLDLWNRFQLAQGIFPSAARLVVSIGIVGGTLVAGFLV